MASGVPLVLETPVESVRRPVESLELVIEFQVVEGAEWILGGADLQRANLDVFLAGDAAGWRGSCVLDAEGWAYAKMVAQVQRPRLASAIASSTAAQFKSNAGLGHATMMMKANMQPSTSAVMRQVMEAGAGTRPA